MAGYQPSWEARQRRGMRLELACRLAAWVGVLFLAGLLLRVAYQAVGWVVFTVGERRGVAVYQLVETHALWPGLARRAEIVEALEPGEGLVLHSWLNLGFLRRPPSRFALQAGFWPAIVGSLWILALVTLLSFPLGVGAAVYLEEYARPGRLTSLIQTNIANLAGVPSIIYGILGLALFVRALQPVTQGRSVLSGALTMSLLVLPIVIIASREAIRAVPGSLREAAFAMGGSRWEVIRDHLLPAALPGILTGTILALSRAIGEAAPLVTIGALTYVAHAAVRPTDPFTVMPIQIFGWTSLPGDEFRFLAAAGILVLLAILLSMNTVAIYLRQKLQIRW